MTITRTSLTAYAGSMREPDPKQVRRLARQAWQENGLIVLDPAWVQSWGDREFVSAVAAKVHGKRNVR